MSEKWYPVIDYEICKECGACFNKCKHEVYKKEGNRLNRNNNTAIKILIFKVANLI